MVATSKPVPVKQVLASSQLTVPQLAAVQEYLLGLEAAKESGARLAAFKVTGFAPADEGQVKELGAWLGV